MPIFLALIYIFISLSLGWLGRNKTFGFIGNFLCALVFTPLVGLVLLLAQNGKCEK
jgi:hypothetical protein